MNRRPLALLTSGLVMLALAACGNPVDKVIKADDVSFTSNVDDKASGVPVSTLVKVAAKDGELESVSLTAGQVTIPGKVRGNRWAAAERLEPGTTYTLVMKGVNDDDKAGSETVTFTTQALTRDQQIYPSVAPLDGETVGVGMPVIVYFDLPVKNRAAFEREMHVTTKPAVSGSWSWLNDREVHWRPQHYWKPGTSVNVDLDLNGVSAGNGLYGQQDQDVDFRIGRSAISTVDVANHTLTLRVNGAVQKTIPVTTGDDRHRTRQGIKVIMEKHSSVDMDAETTGVDSEDPDYYNIEDVRWAMRLTFTGEFLHAAPWSVSSQGRANVSHGCTGMSMENARWLYSQSIRGDVVEYINSPRGLESGNGWTDWNVSWDSWLAGSALSAEERENASSRPSTTPASPESDTGLSTPHDPNT